MHVFTSLTWHQFDRHTKCSYQDQKASSLVHIATAGTTCSRQPCPSTGTAYPWPRRCEANRCRSQMRRAKPKVLCRQQSVCARASPALVRPRTSGRAATGGRISAEQIKEYVNSMCFGSSSKASIPRRCQPIISICRRDKLGPANKSVRAHRSNPRTWPHHLGLQSLQTQASRTKHYYSAP